MLSSSLWMLNEWQGASGILRACILQDSDDKMSYQMAPSNNLTSACVWFMILDGKIVSAYEGDLKFHMKKALWICNKRRVNLVFSSEGNEALSFARPRQRGFAEGRASPQFRHNSWHIFFHGMLWCFTEMCFKSWDLAPETQRLLGFKS